MNDSKKYLVKFKIYFNALYLINNFISKTFNKLT